VVEGCVLIELDMTAWPPISSISNDFLVAPSAIASTEIGGATQQRSHKEGKPRHFCSSREPRLSYFGQEIVYLGQPAFERGKVYGLFAWLAVKGKREDKEAMIMIGPPVRSLWFEAALTRRWESG